MTSDTPLPPSLQRNPELDAWIRIDAGGTVTVRTGKAELGQGIRTALARIAAEELEVELDRIRVETADTASGPEEGLTVGSASLEESGSALRLAAADARRHLIERAAAAWSLDPRELRVEDGTILAPGGELRTDYWTLHALKSFSCRVRADAPPRSPEQHRIVGRPGPRIDLRAKLTGGAFVHDLAPAGLLFGRVVRPPTYRAVLRSVDHEAARLLPGVRAVVHDGSFLGVVAEREDVAVRARELLLAHAAWDVDAGAAAQDAYASLSGPCQSYLVVDGVPRPGPLPAAEPIAAAHTLSARYRRPFLMHASIGPSAALAHWIGNDLTVWSHTQGVGPLRQALAHALRMPAERIRVVHVEGSGCYGHNGQDDVAFDAALLARAVAGWPVRVQWMRDDEHAWEPYGSAMEMRLEAGLDASGRIVEWRHEAISHSHLRQTAPTPGHSDLAGAWHRAEPLLPNPSQPWLIPQGGIHRNAQPIYAFPSLRIVKSFVPDSPLRVSTLRSLGAYGNLFAIESFMDELAQLAGRDPVEFRLAHLQDKRARAVLAAVAERGGWGAGRGPGRGQGVALGRYKGSKCYAALLVEIELDAASQPRLTRAVIAADAGEIVDPDGLTNQLEGGVIQAASWALKEELRFAGSRVLSRDWESYPILDFTEVPDSVETILIDRPGLPYLGAGEATQGLTPAALANALARACGARVRELPLTAARILRAREAPAA